MSHKQDIPKVNIGEAVDIINAIIPDTPPTTKMGRFLRWFKRISKVSRKLFPSDKDFS
jgi:hypothetical protein